MIFSWFLFATFTIYILQIRKYSFCINIIFPQILHRKSHAKFDDVCESFHFYSTRKYGFVPNRNNEIHAKICNKFVGRQAFDVRSNRYATTDNIHLARGFFVWVRLLYVIFYKKKWNINLKFQYDVQESKRNSYFSLIVCSLRVMHSLRHNSIVLGRRVDGLESTFLLFWTKQKKQQQ